MATKLSIINNFEPIQEFLVLLKNTKPNLILNTEHCTIIFKINPLLNL